MDMTPQGLAVVRSFEGRALKAYKDSVGVVTIGYGNTNYDSFAVAYLGKKIEMGDTITEEQAEYLLIETMRRNYMPAVTAAMGEAAPQAGDAGGSFHYNTGALKRASWVKLWKSAAAGETIKASLMSWNKAGGKPLAGLTRRRAREGAILVDGDYGPEGRTPPPILAGDGGRVIKASSPDHHLAGTPGMMRIDDKGPQVADLNDSLEVIGFKGLKGDTFTLATQSAVIEIQKDHKALTVDGIVGPATRAAIAREADLKRKMGNVAKTAGGGVVPAGTIQAAGWHIPGSVWISAAVLAVIAVGWLAWRYQDEVIAIAKRVRS
jgi:lysozyme